MIISNNSCNFPMVVYLFPNMNKLKSSAILFTVFFMTKHMAAGFNCAIIFDGINFEWTFYQFTGKAIVSREDFFKGFHGRSIISYSGIVLKNLQTVVKKGFEFFKILRIKGLKQKTVLQTQGVIKFFVNGLLWGLICGTVGTGRSKDKSGKQVYKMKFSVQHNFKNRKY